MQKKLGLLILILLDPDWFLRIQDINGNSDTKSMKLKKDFLNYIKHSFNIISKILPQFGVKRPGSEFWPITGSSPPAEKCLRTWIICGQLHAGLRLEERVGQRDLVVVLCSNTLQHNFIFRKRSIESIKPECEREKKKKREREEEKIGQKKESEKNCTNAILCSNKIDSNCVSRKQ